MTCFWDGIIQALDISDYNYVGSNYRLNQEQLINLLKNFIYFIFEFYIIK